MWVPLFALSFVLTTSVAWLLLRRMRVADSFRQIRNKRQNGLGML